MVGLYVKFRESLFLDCAGWINCNYRAVGFIEIRKELLALLQGFGNREYPGNRALPCPDAFAPLVRGRWVRRVIQEISGSESAAPVEEQKANGLIAIARGNAVGIINQTRFYCPEGARANSQPKRTKQCRNPYQKSTFISSLAR